jgi:hypothetical protein
MKFICLSLSVLTLAMTSLGAESFRTDINPALRYYQAFSLAPDLSEADHQYLFNSEWRDRHLDERFGRLIAKYDNPFKLIRQAAQAEVPCDWGIDMTEGPHALLPGLARAKAVAQTARLRVLWHLQNGRPAEARDDLLAAFALGRNTARDGVLISALVQVAMENIVCSIVAENFYQFSPETLKQLVGGFDASPARGTMAQCVATEQYGFHDWLLRKIDELRQENPGNETKVVEQIREFIGDLGGEEGGRDLNFADKVLKAAGGTSDGVIKLVRELEPLYQRVSELLVLPYGEFGPQMKAFNAEVEKHANPLVSMFFAAYDKCRQKEFAIEVSLAMVRAAVEYKLHGEAGLKSVIDPCGSGPFAFRRFVFEGVDRGLELRSPFKGRGFDEVLIFVEKGGPPFQVTAKNAGKAPTHGPASK